MVESMAVKYNDYLDCRDQDQLPEGECRQACSVDTAAVEVWDEFVQAERSQLEADRQSERRKQGYPEGQCEAREDDHSAEDVLQDRSAECGKGQGLALSGSIQESWKAETTDAGVQRQGEKAKR